MGYSRETIYKALSEADNNQIKVAYQLVVDHHRMIKECKCQGVIKMHISGACTDKVLL
jgi:carbon catabolite-derepressing protein kinase